MSLVHELEDAILLEEQYSPVSSTIQGSPYKSQLPSSSWPAGPRFLWKCTIAQNNVGEDKWSRGLFLLGPRTIARLPESRRCGTGMRTDIQIIGQNQGSRNKPLHLESMDFNKDVKTIQWGEDSLFSKQCWDMAATHRNKNEVKPPKPGFPRPWLQSRRSVAGEQAKLHLLHPYCTAWTTPHPAIEKLSSTKPVPGSKMFGDHCPTSQHIQKLTPMLHRHEYKPFREKSKHLWCLAGQWFLS